MKGRRLPGLGDADVQQADSFLRGADRDVAIRGVLNNSVTVTSS